MSLDVLRFDREEYGVTGTFCSSFAAKQVFSASPILLHLLELLRVPLKNTVNTFLSHLIDQRMDQVLTDEDNIIDVIQALQGNWS